jgi:hypothetical protein
VEGHWRVEDSAGRRGCCGVNGSREMKKRDVAEAASKKMPLLLFVGEGTPEVMASPLTSPLANTRGLLDLAQGSVQGAEVAGAKRLDARHVATAIELRGCVRAASSRGFLRGAEP